MATPLISICLPNLNTRPFLEERMETILAQTVTDWELIICDSYSDDGSWEFFQKFKSDPRIRMYQVPRDGIYAGWNECLRRVTGHYIYIATSDDTMSPDCLKKLLTPLEHRPDLKIAVCDFQDIDEQSRAIDRRLRPQHQFLGQWMQTASVRNGKTEFLLHAAFGTTIWGTMNAALFRRDLLQQTGYFRTDLGSRADEEWALRASLASDIAFVPGKLATWRVHPAQATSRWASKRQAARWLLESIESVLRDETVDIPSAWKQIRGWAELISAYHRQNYELTFRLFRWEARAHPVTFGCDLSSALFQTPRWLLTQARRGFSWSDEREINSGVYAKELIDLFTAPWPPQPLQLP